MFSHEEEPEAPAGMISITDFLNAAMGRVQQGTSPLTPAERAATTLGTPAQQRGPVTEDELHAFVAVSIAKVERARRRMARDQAEIEQLKAETRMMISKLLAA